MRTLFLAAALAVFPTTAHAVGVGTTAGLGAGGISLNITGSGVSFYTGTPAGFLPSLDLGFGRNVLQIHALETLRAIADEEIFLGANMYFGVVEVPVSGAAVGVVEPGFGVDLLADPLTLGLTGECRFGVRVPGQMSFGVYVVPALGAVVGDVDTELVTAGTLQFSVLFGS